MGAVEFSAYAFNADGVKSETHRLDYAPPETAPKPQPKPRRAFVIVVGVNAYQNEAWDLHYAVRDAEATQRIVADRLRGSKAADGSKAFDEVHTVSLTAKRDESGNIVGTATRADLLAVLDVLAGKAGDWERLQGIPGAIRWQRLGPMISYIWRSRATGCQATKGDFICFCRTSATGWNAVVDDTLLKNTLDSDLLAHYLAKWMRATSYW